MGISQMNCVDREETVDKDTGNDKSENDPGPVNDFKWEDQKVARWMLVWG